MISSFHSDTIAFMESQPRDLYEINRENIRRGNLKMTHAFPSGAVRSFDMNTRTGYFVQFDSLEDDSASRRIKSTPELNKKKISRQSVITCSDESRHPIAFNLNQYTDGRHSFVINQLAENRQDQLIQYVYDTTQPDGSSPCSKCIYYLREDSRNPLQFIFTFDQNTLNSYVLSVKSQGNGRILRQTHGISGKAISNSADHEFTLGPLGNRSVRLIVNDHLGDIIVSTVPQVVDITTLSNWMFYNDESSWQQVPKMILTSFKKP